MLHQNEVIKCVSIKWLKYCSVPFTSTMSSGNNLRNCLSNVHTGTLKYFNHFIDTNFVIPL